MRKEFFLSTLLIPHPPSLDGASIVTLPKKLGGTEKYRDVLSLFFETFRQATAVPKALDAFFKMEDVGSQDGSKRSSKCHNCSTQIPGGQGPY